MMPLGNLIDKADKVADFAKFDTNRDGLLDDAEIEAAKDQVFKRFKAEAKTYNRQVLEHYDLDQNGKLDGLRRDGQPDSELELFRRLVSWHEQGEQIQKTLIAKFDIDGDGQLSGDELRQALELRVAMEYERSLTVLFRECDKNHDGKFDELELAEAKQLAIKRYDRNEDNDVDARESFLAVMEAQLALDGVDLPQWGIKRTALRNGLVNGRRPIPTTSIADQIKRFDLDGDGRLNAEEQKRANEAQQQQQQQQVIAPPIDE